MLCFDNEIHLTFMAIRHSELNQINQREAETLTVCKTERKQERKLEGSYNNEGRVWLLCVSAVASSWLLVAAAQPQGPVTVN